MEGYATVAGLPALVVADQFPGLLGFSPLAVRSTCAAALWSSLLAGAGWVDYQVGRRRLGRKVLRGSRLVTPEEFRRLVPGDGMGFPYLCPGPGGAVQRFMRIPAEEESCHILVCGDIGRGKSALFHHLLMQIAERPDEGVLIYDPALEFWQCHGRPDLGDVLLHPLYRHCPYWSPSLEVENDLDPKTLAMSFLPNKEEGKETFWDLAPRSVFSFLIDQLAGEGGSVSDLLRWLSDPALIEERVAASTTALAPVIDRDAPEQRSGVLAIMNLIADSLTLLPPDDGRPRFSFAEWEAAKWTGERRPWVFIGSRPSERDALRPLVSAWLDTAFCKLMKNVGGPRTWVVLDELPSLQRLPKLLTAVAEGRKYNVSFMLGFQGRALVEALYGKATETLMSMPQTHVYLRTGELAAAEWCAGNIGKPEMERGTESVTTSAGDGRDSMNIGTERRADYLVLPNEIQNLPRREGYFCHGGHAVRFRYDHPGLAVVNEFEERPRAPRKKGRPGLKLLAGRLHSDD
jgi:hypothetical protein